MKKRIIALALSLALCITPTLAAGVDETFPVTQTYPGYTDVKDSDWFYASVKLCYEVELMRGTGAGFAPSTVMTVGEVAAISARIHAAMTGTSIVLGTPRPGETIPWYQWYVSYLEALGIAVPDPTKPATRAQFLALLSPILADEALTPINKITALPDSDSAAVLRFYNAGILTGVDKWGTFAPDKTLTRAEAAAMVARITRDDLRQAFTPADYTPFLAAGCRPSDVYLQGGGRTVTGELYLPLVTATIATLEQACVASGVEFNWFNTYGDQTFLVYVKDQVLTHLGVTAKDGTALYKAFDLQVFYSKLIDLKGNGAKTPAIL